MTDYINEEKIRNEKQRVYDIYKEEYDSVAKMKASLESELKSLFFFQINKKKELEERIADVSNMLTMIESKMKFNECEHTTLDSNADIKNTDIMDTQYEYIMENFIKTGKKVEAIKYYREQTGLGLKEAKDIVDKMFDDSYTSEISEMQASEISLEDYIRTHFDSTTKIQAIKYYRERTGLGLKEAKTVVDNIL